MLVNTAGRLKANLFRFLHFPVQERLCKFIGKEIYKRSHKERRDYRACSYYCTDTVNGGAGEEVESDSKDDADDVSFETLKAICEAVSIPVVAIGGITKENTPQLAGSGICGIAVISAIYGQENIYEAAASLKKVTEEMVNA